MTVAELIQKLQALPADLQVVCTFDTYVDSIRATGEVEVLTQDNGTKCVSITMDGR